MSDNLGHVFPPQISQNGARPVSTAATGRNVDLQVCFVTAAAAFLTSGQTGKLIHYLEGHVVITLITH